MPHFCQKCQKLGHICDTSKPQKHRKGVGQVVSIAQKATVPIPIPASDLAGVEEGVRVPVIHKEKGKVILNNNEGAALSINASD